MISPVSFAYTYNISALNNKNKVLLPVFQGSKKDVFVSTIPK